jgi:hypothetical protein
MDCDYETGGCTVWVVARGRDRLTVLSVSPMIYLSFFLGRSWLVCPHFFFRQLVERGGSLA